MSPTADPDAESSDLVVVHSPTHQRFEAHLDGEVVGELDYVVAGGVHRLLHVETEPEWRGRGFAAELVRLSLDELHAHGARVEAVCPYVVGYLRAHPEYADMVTALPDPDQPLACVIGPRRAS